MGGFREEVSLATFSYQAGPPSSLHIGKFWRESFLLFTHPDGEAAKLPDAEVRSTNASSKKLNGAKQILSFFELRFSNFSMLILTIRGTFFAK